MIRFKGAGNTKAYGLDYLTSYLTGGRSISDISVTVTPNDMAATTRIVDGVASVTVSGGSIGKLYAVRCTAQIDDGGQDDETIMIRCG